MTQRLIQQLGDVAIVGAGTMGTALCSGLVERIGVDPARITVSNRTPDKLEALADNFSVHVTTNNAEAVFSADTVFIAVKPQVLPDVAQGLARALQSQTLVVSVAAGVSTAKLAELLDGAGQVVRVMPNTPLTVGAGVAGVSGGRHCLESNVALVCSVFDRLGGSVAVPEDKQDVVTALSGSGPAYFELFLQAMANAGVELGLDYDSSLELALKTMGGTARLIEATGQDLAQAIKAVSSPGGTTVAALDAMRAGHVEEAIANGVFAAARRSGELGD